jgi:hypothetical protein
MIKFFVNKELSQKLNINLAKWKRWSREFLPPDPLGGLQSGYARQYNPNEAFTVYLGGYLVADLKFSIPEAKQILHDLRGWLGEKGFYFDAKGSNGLKKGVDNIIQKYTVSIIKDKYTVKEKMGFRYQVRGIISNRPIHYQGFDIMEELYVETSIGSHVESPSTFQIVTGKTLNITGFLNGFVERMELDRAYYRSLNGAF